MKQNQQFTIGLVVAAVILGGYMFFVESKKESPTDTKDVEIWSLSDNQAKDLNTLAVTDGGKTETYTRSGDTWTVASAPGRTVEKTGFESPYNYLKTLTATRKVEDKPSDAGKYGFKTPATVVRWGDDNTKYKIEVGDKTPTNDSYYVHVLKDDGVYTIASYKVDAWKTLVSKPPLAAAPTPAPNAATGAAAPASGAAPVQPLTPSASVAPAHAPASAKAVMSPAAPAPKGSAVTMPMIKASAAISASVAPASSPAPAKAVPTVAPTK